MAEAIRSIHERRGGATQGINTVAAIRCEAMRLARNAVRDRMRAQKIKVTYVAASEITAAAKAWCKDHPELAHEAFGNIIRWQLRRLLSSVRKDTGNRTLPSQREQKIEELSQ